MKIKILLLLLSLMMQGCHKKNEEERTLDIKYIKEIEKLDSEEKQKNFLINIINKDQAIRNEYELVITKYGYDSKQYKEHTEEMKKIDEVNLLKIEYYLKLYGHPTLKQHGEKAVYGPCLVIHHNSKIEVSEKHFSLLEKAYKSGDLEESLFLFYLNNFYHIKYGKEYKVKNASNEINEIITEINS